MSSFLSPASFRCKQGMQEVPRIPVWEEEGENKGKTPLDDVPERRSGRFTQKTVTTWAVPSALAAPVKSPVGQWRDQCNYHRLDSLGGKSTFVTIVTTVTMSSVVIMLVSFCIWIIRSSTHPADSLASASWSQHSSMVSQSIAMPCSKHTSPRVKEKSRRAELAAGFRQVGLPSDSC